jgi:hypothetical protein
MFHELTGMTNLRSPAAVKQLAQSSASPGDIAHWKFSSQ